MAAAEDGSEGVLGIAKAAREASLVLGASSNSARSAALTALATALGTEEVKAAVLGANEVDIQAASEAHLAPALAGRLALSGKYEGVVEGVRQIAAAEDPVGVVTLKRELSEGLELQRVSTPIGVLCIIFESRPDAALQIGSLCIKSGNAVILKGGKEAVASNKAIVAQFQDALKQAGLPPSAVQLVESREDVSALLALDEYIDLVIPRGSKALVKHIQSNTRIPVLGHADGICAVYLHADAQALPQRDVQALVVDAKTQYVAACNAAETLLLHEDAVETVWPGVAAALVEAGVVLLCDEASLQAVAGLPAAPAPDAAGSTTRSAGGVEAAGADAFDTEFLGLTMAVRVVPSLQAAVQHINKHGSAHTDSILTADASAAAEFLATVASANVYHNASTRFADGQRYGFGAELGISTNRIHARGPVGLEGMVTYKYTVQSGLTGKVEGGGAPALSWVGQFSGAEPARAFTHVTKAV